MPLRRYALVPILTALLAALLPDGAWAQFDQYRVPGAAGERPVDRKKALEGAMETAPWRLGPVRVVPWLGLRSAEYVDAAVEEEGDGDFTATPGAGLRGYLHSGPQVIWVAHALPEYVWWQESEDRRRLNGRYGVGAFAFFNRLGVEATATRQDEQGYVTPEVLQPVHQRTDRAGLSLLLALGGRISVFTSGERIAVRDLQEGEGGASLSLLGSFDRDETLLRAGLRYDLPRGWSVGLGAERSEVEFADASGLDRSNSGTSPLLLVEHQTDDRFLSLEVSRRALDPEPGSSFVPYEETAGELTTLFNAEGRLSYGLYGGRRIVYSLEQGYSYLQDDRIGATGTLKLGWRTQLQAFAEVGRNDYVPELPGIPGRRDDTRSFGATLTFEVRSPLSLSLRAARSEFDSNLPGEDRSFTTLGGTLSFGIGRSPWY